MRPGTTLRSLHLSLTEIGPATADLAFVAGHARFAAAEPIEPARPALMVWRALVADVGLRRGPTARRAHPRLRRWRTSRSTSAD